jgi:hypothetical protein
MVFWKQMGVTRKITIEVPEALLSKKGAARNR